MSEVKAPLEVAPVSEEHNAYFDQWVYLAPGTTYGLSVVQGPLHYCSMRNGSWDRRTFEVALVHWADDAEPDGFKVVYAKGTEFAYDVAGWQTPEQIAGHLLTASKLTEHSDDAEYPSWDDDEEDANV